MVARVELRRPRRRIEGGLGVRPAAVAGPVRASDTDQRHLSTEG
jgi:hypothetical protein